MLPVLKLVKEVLIIGAIAGVFFFQSAISEKPADKGNYCPLDGVVSVQSPPEPCC